MIIRTKCDQLILTLPGREAHEKQKQVARERKGAKPYADLLARSKKLWERLRRKSHVPREERKQLVGELFGIVNGRVKDFVFKHDSVRVIQTALKYANETERKQIAIELKGEYRALAESRYAKFLIGKLIVHGDSEIRDMIVPEFYGHIKRLMRHSEASWIVDDIYRTVATHKQKAIMLREWYGSEFALFSHEQKQPTMELATILERHPEKRNSIMHYLHEFINLLVQKKTTGFTMLHDAMLQYFLNTKPDSSEASEFIELVKGDEEGDLMKNLAFTPCGARLVCLCLAYSNAKDRKVLLRVYRDIIKMLAADLYGHTILLTAYEVIDDTKLTSKAIFPELLSQPAPAETRKADLLQQVTDLTARIPVLYPFCNDNTKWLLPELDAPILSEVREIRATTSKKDPATRRTELIAAASPTLLEFISESTHELIPSTFGARFVTEVLFSATGDKTAALTAIATTVSENPETAESAAAGRMLKALVQGGRFDSATKTVRRVEPPLQFGEALYRRIRNDVMTWAAGPNAFVVVALVETADFDGEMKAELLKTLGEKKNKETLMKLAASNSKAEGTKGRKKADEGKQNPATSAARILLENIG